MRKEIETNAIFACVWRDGMCGRRREEGHDGNERTGYILRIIIIKRGERERNEGKETSE